MRREAASKIRSISEIVGGKVLIREEYMVECGFCAEEYPYSLTVYRKDLPTCPSCAQKRNFKYWLSIPKMGFDSKMELLLE